MAIMCVCKDPHEKCTYMLLVLTLFIYLKIMEESPDHKIHCFLFEYQLSHPSKKINEMIAWGDCAKCLSTKLLRSPQRKQLRVRRRTQVRVNLYIEFWHIKGSSCKQAATNRMLLIKYA